MQENGNHIHMELRHLKSFIVAARCLNFSEAARRMCVTQSTFSQTIKQLEDELGSTLFFRNSHEVTLTEAGNELLPFAEKAMQAADDCTQRLEDLRRLQCGTLSIGVTHSFNMVMHETLKEFMRRYPVIRLSIIYKPMTDLVGFPVALPAKGLQARNVLESIMSDATELNVRVEMDEVTPLLRLVRNTGICTILSTSATEDDDELCAIPIRHEGCRMEGCVQTLKEGYRKESAKEFIRILCETSLVKKRIGEWLR